ncbi:kinase-like domain-containing protein [Mycena rebaudengoi]|nr:kinase-like domain-containing protein [Mycena rebaudengoi]
MEVDTIHQTTQEDPQSQTQTQPQTQSQQSQGATDQRNAHSWGLLVPCARGIKREHLLKSTPEVTIGRNASNHVSLSWSGLSNVHAIISWNGEESGESVVTIQDKSKNGTFIRGIRIEKDKTRILKDGDEISFAIAKQPKTENVPDYRYVYRDLLYTPRDLYKHYDISVKIGQGAFASVYKGLHVATSDWVAVKVLDRTRQGGTSIHDPAREINIMKKIRHPNVCKLRDVFWNSDSSVDLVLELVDGGDLLSLILAEDGLKEWKARHITFQMCKALAYIHRQGITHRDLKPENILLTADRPPIVKIADFGLAKLVDSLTVLRTMVGTPAYIAPEVVTQRDGRGYTNLVDSWSIGVIVFAMLTALQPFPKIETKDLKELIGQRQADLKLLDKKKASDPAKKFIRRLLEVDPTKRMSVADALSDPWLTAYEIIYDFNYPDDLPEGESLDTISVYNSFTAPPPVHIPIGPSAPSRKSVTDTVERRSDVLQLAVEGGTNLVEPSPEMEEYAQSQHDDQVLAMESQTSEYLYGPTAPGPSAPAVMPVPAPQYAPMLEPAPLSPQDSLYGPVPARTPAPIVPSLPAVTETSAAGGGATKRTFAALRTADSFGSSLSSLEGSFTAPPKKKGKMKTKTPEPPQVDPPTRSSPRKGKGKETEMEVERPTAAPASRRSTRPTRAGKR